MPWPMPPPPFPPPPKRTCCRFDNYSHRVDGGMLTIRNFRFGGEAMGITAVVNWAPYICEEVQSVLETELCGRVPTSGAAPLPPHMRGAEGSSIIIESSEFGGGCGAGGVLREDRGGRHCAQRAAVPAGDPGRLVPGADPLSGAVSRSQHKRRRGGVRPRRRHRVKGTALSGL